MKRIIPFDDYNHRIHVGAEIVGSVLPTWGNNALKNGWKLMEILSIGHGFRKTNTADLAPTLTGSGFERNNFLMDNMERLKVTSISYIEHFAPDGSGGTGYSEYDIVLVRFDSGEEKRVYVSSYYNGINASRKDLWDALPTFDNPREAYEMLGEALPWIKDENIDELDPKYLEPKMVSKKHYRIRKLTPTECLRLMKVSDSDIAKMKGAGISDSQLYKLAGNSIVVSVLEGIFREMHFEENPLRVFEAFAGYGSQSMALRNIGVPHEVVGISEIDKYAIMAYNATHPETVNFGDVSKIDWAKVPDFDLFTYSFPCTDISNAGAQAGFEEGSGTRSSLLWDCQKAIMEKHPKYLLMENVKAIVSKKFLPGLLKWQEFLSRQGYVNFIEILNAKDYGIPQNRERCFLVSILDAGWYQFPEPVALRTRLVDLLEDEVDEKYYLDQSRVDSFMEGLSDEKRRKLEEGCA